MARQLTAVDQEEYDRYRELQVAGIPFDCELQPPLEVHIYQAYQYCRPGSIHITCVMSLLNRSTRALYFDDLIKLVGVRIDEHRFQLVDLGAYTSTEEQFGSAPAKSRFADVRTERNPLRRLDLNRFFQGTPLLPGKKATGSVQLRAISLPAKVKPLSFQNLVPVAFVFRETLGKEISILTELSVELQSNESAPATAPPQDAGPTMSPEWKGILDRLGEQHKKEALKNRVHLEEGVKLMEEQMKHVEEQIKYWEEGRANKDGAKAVATRATSRQGAARATHKSKPSLRVEESVRQRKAHRHVAPP